MKRLAWSEIEARAAVFAQEWANEAYEKGESQSFWTDFLSVFGVHRRRAGGYFEYAVKLAGKKYGFIDMFMPAKLLVEQKSAGRDLAKASGQALQYLDGLPDHDLPKIVVACDFQHFEVLDLDTRKLVAFPLADLPKHVRLFGPLVEVKSVDTGEDSPVNRRAAEAMAKLHNDLEDSGYAGRDLELLLVRIVFCLFAEDSGIFDPKQFSDFVRNRTDVDGTDLGPKLIRLFEVLDTHPDSPRRGSNLDPDLASFRYINGGLFRDPIETPDFNTILRIRLLDAGKVDWSQVSPAIFGAMFQAVMDNVERHDVGAHYTSEENILRVIKPLFLDGLYAEYEEAASIKTEAARRSKLDSLHDRIAGLRFLDPACGCGNFLVIAYRELRRLEHRIVRAQLKNTTLVDVRDLLRVSVDQFNGIEIEEFPAMIARTALWLTDHQMNVEASRELGHAYTRLPLTEGANILHANALTTDWSTVIEPEELDFIMGNPPFLGSRVMNKGQKAQLRAVSKGYRQAGFLDFVVGWYILADRMMDQNPSIETAFVSTNSITQGEQPGIFWPKLYENGNHITFAHRTFQWTNQAKGIAHVHCVIVGFARKPRLVKQLFYYPEIFGEPVLHLAETINPYLIDGRGSEHVVANREEQISGAPKMSFGNMAADGGNLLLSASERDALVGAEPGAADWILPCLGAQEFLQGRQRFALWLQGSTAGQRNALALVKARVEATRQIRLHSSRPELADTPWLFAQITQDPHRAFLLVPRASSSNREWVPMGFFDGGVVATDACLTVEGADDYLFGILTSRMHMDWLRVVGGRLKSDYRYSKDLVYNNFVFPDATEEQRSKLAELARGILAARASEPDGTLADLYDPTNMPAPLRRAHRLVDEYVDKLYRQESFANEEDRAVYLLALNADAASRT
jgi:hypothetical protein